MPADWPGGVRHGGDVTPTCRARTEREKARTETVAAGRACVTGGGETGFSSGCGARRRTGSWERGVSCNGGGAKGPGHPRACCCRSTTPEAAGEELGMGASVSPGKPFDISKRDVGEAWLKVKENQGAPGVDGQSIADFHKDLKNNLYKVWNRMWSGSYFPLSVRAVQIDKPHGEGMRTLGIPTAG